MQLAWTDAFAGNRLLAKRALGASLLNAKHSYSDKHETSHTLLPQARTYTYSQTINLGVLVQI